MEALRIHLVFVNQHICRLRRANLVVVNLVIFVFARELVALLRRGIATVVKTLVVP